MADLNRRLDDKQLTCEMTPEAKTFIVDNAYDPVYGARPLRRYVQRYVETLIAKKILGDDLMPGTILMVDVNGGELVVTAEKRA